MSPTEDLTANDSEGRSNLIALGLVSLLAGAVAGLVAAIFRLTLDHADRFRDALVAWAHSWQLAGLLLVVAASAAAVGIAAWLVRRYSPYASGSGIPHVEAVLNGQLAQAPYRLIWVKFLGGLLAIGSGLALGREGPSVQMGAGLANLLGEVFRRNAEDCKALLAAGAGTFPTGAADTIAADELRARASA
jgi:CIC family chloride channel protein